MPEPTRVDQQKGFILTTRSWKESSLLLDIFTQNFGRKILIARSARKATSTLRGILNPFIPIAFSWFGKSNLLTLHKANWIGGHPAPQGMALLSAWYINELIFKLVPPDDPYPKLFMALENSMENLATQQDISSQLRKFEWRLLNELGLIPDIRLDIHQRPIQENQYYQIHYESNLIPVSSRTIHTNDSPSLCISGKTLMNIYQENYSLETTKQEARIFFQYLIERYIPNNQIITSQILKQLVLQID